MVSMQATADGGLLFRPMSLIYVWEAWRLRLLSYILGSYEFLMNMGINISRGLRNALTTRPTTVKGHRSQGSQSLGDESLGHRLEPETPPFTFANKVCFDQSTRRSRAASLH